MHCGIAPCNVYGVCVEKHEDPKDLKAEIARLGKLAIDLVREGEAGGAYFSNHLKRQAYKAAGEELPEYLAEPWICIYCKGQIVDCRCVSCGEAG